MDYKRQDWMFRVQLAQSQVTEEYRQSANYNRQLQDAISSYADHGQQLRTALRQTGEAITSVQMQVFNLESQSLDQRHQMLKYRVEGERDLTRDLNVKQGSEAPLETMQVALTDIMDSHSNWSDAEPAVRAALIKSGTSEGLQGAIMTIGNSEGRGSISHRQAARLVSNYILTSGEFREWYGVNKTDIDTMVESAFDLDAGSLTGLDTDYDDAYDAGLIDINNASPIERGQTYYTEGQAALAARQSELVAHQTTLDSLISETMQTQLNLEAELEQRGEPEPPDYDAILEAAMEGYQEPASRGQQRLLNRERRRLRIQNRMLDEASPETRAIVLAGAEASRRKRLGLAVSDDEETIARATELMSGYGESFDPNELQTIADQWARGRYQSEYEAANPGATEIYWDSDQIATYQNDLMSAVLGQWDNQYGSVQDAAATPTTTTEGAPPEPEPPLEEEMYIEPPPEAE
jgi:hypothetical protein